MKIAEYIFVLLLAAAALFVHLNSTKHYGVGCESDSVDYIEAARNTAYSGCVCTTEAATGDLVPLMHFPPLFPVSMAPVFLADKDPGTKSLRFYYALLLVLNIAAGYLFLRSLLGERLILLWSGMLLATVSSTFLLIHFSILSEALFLVFINFGLWQLVRYLQAENGNAMGHLIWMSVLMALALFTRFSAIAFILTAMGLIVLFGRHSWKARFIHAGTAAAVSFGPFFIWNSYMKSVHGTQVERAIQYHLVEWPSVVNSVDLITDWVMPYDYLKIAVWLVPIGIGVYMLLSDRKLTAGLRPVLFAGALIISYFVFMLLIKSLVDNFVALNHRIWSPILFPVIGCFLCLWALAESKFSNIPRVITNSALVLLCLLTIRAQALTSRDTLVRPLKEHGMGYNSKQYLESDLLQYLQASDSPAMVTNNTQLLSYFIGPGTSIYTVPLLYNPLTLVGNEGLPEDIDLTAERLKDGGLAVFFENHYEYLLQEKALMDSIGLQLERSFPDGRVYRK